MSVGHVVTAARAGADPGRARELRRATNHFCVLHSRFLNTQRPAAHSGGRVGQGGECSSLGVCYNAPQLSNRKSRARFYDLNWLRRLPQVPSVHSPLLESGVLVWWSVGLALGPSSQGPGDYRGL